MYDIQISLVITIAIIFVDKISLLIGLCSVVVTAVCVAEKIMDSAPAMAL